MSDKKSEFVKRLDGRNLSEMEIEDILHEIHKNNQTISGICYEPDRSYEEKVKDIVQIVDFNNRLMKKKPWFERYHKMLMRKQEQESDTD